MNTLLDDVIKHMTPDRAFESHYSDLVAMISRIITHMTDYNILFSMVNHRERGGTWCSREGRGVVGVERRDVGIERRNVG